MLIGGLPTSPEEPSPLEATSPTTTRSLMVTSLRGCVSPGQAGVGSIEEGGYLMEHPSRTSLFEDTYPHDLTELLAQIHTRVARLTCWER